MTQAIWKEVDEYLGDLLVPEDPALDAAVAANAAAGMPPISVSPLQGKLLHLLARIHGSTRILEIGTLGGYSTIWLARALPPDGRLITLELEARHADIARANLERAGVAGRVEIRLGAALETLPRLAAENRGPFDLVFIDADKENTPGYFDWALKLTRKGSAIIVDNVVRKGEVANAATADEDVRGIRQFLERAAAEPRVQMTAIQTVGIKGYDGFALALVIA
jgi:predicted O-methyltransferase YrrM